MGLLFCTMSSFNTCLPGTAFNLVRQPDKYTELMKTYYGTAGLRAASALLAGKERCDEVAIQYPLTLAGIENCDR